MARFFLSGIYGNSTCSGRSGFTAGGRRSVGSTHTRGWHAGVEVDCIKMADGTDRFDVYMTPGSAGAGRRVLVGQVYQRKPSGQPHWRPAKGRKNTKR